MAAKFEKIKEYADVDLVMPVRKTADSAGYDICAAEDVIVPSLQLMSQDAKKIWEVADDEYIDTNLMADFTSQVSYRPTLVPTGLKCRLDPGTYLQLSVRSSTPLKYWLVLANGVGIIDRDYYGDASTGREGHIMVQLYNLSPFNIKISKGEPIAQGIILPYAVTEDDVTSGERTGGFGSTSE